MTMRLLQSKGIHESEAEEIAQAAWVRGWERLPQLREKNMVVTWVNSIALNMMRNRCRREPQNQQLADPPDSRSYSSSVTAKVDTETLLAHCNTLERTLLFLHYAFGYTCTEVGARQGLHPATVRVRLLRIRRRLQQQVRRRNISSSHGKKRQQHSKSR